MDFDETLEHVGQFGWIQVFHLGVLSIPMLVGGLFTIPMAFIGIAPHFICAGKPDEDPCSVTPPCEKFVYDSSFTSIATEWNLVCENRQYAEMAQSAYMLGQLVGNFFWGSLADKHGRFGMIIVTHVIQVLAQMAGAYAQTYQQFILDRVIVGFAAGGANVLLVTMALENLHSSRRGLGAALMASGFGMSIALTALWAYHVREWRTFLWTSNIFLLPFFILIWFVPKSARWLASRGRNVEAEDIFYYLSIKNGKTHSRESVKLKKTGGTNAGAVADKSYGASDLFRTPKMARRMYILIWGWLVLGIVYFGLTLSSSSLGGNMYVNVALSGLVEIPITFISTILADRIGRIKTIAGLNMITVVACFGVSLIPSNLEGGSVISSIQTILALTAKMGVAGAMNLQGPFSTELLPTCIRTVGYGVCIMASRCGAVLVPMLMAYFSEPAIYFLYALMTATYVVAVVTVKETLNEPLPDTIEDVENS